MMRDIDAAADNLASQVLPQTLLAGFRELPIDAKIVGIATFAHIAGDRRIKTEALSALRKYASPNRSTCSACGSDEGVDVTRRRDETGHLVAVYTCRTCGARDEIYADAPMPAEEVTR